LFRAQTITQSDSGLKGRSTTTVVLSTYPLFVVVDRALGRLQEQVTEMADDWPPVSLCLCIALVMAIVLPTTLIAYVYVTMYQQLGLHEISTWMNLAVVQAFEDSVEYVVSSCLSVERHSFGL
jgi:hypothetical protein